MRYLLYYGFGLFLLLSLGFSCDEQKPKDHHSKKNIQSFPKFKFDEVEYDFGYIKQDTVVQKTFRFQNIGTKPLHITNAVSTCGCTLPKYPKNQLIAPQKKGQIIVEFDTKGKLGQQNKTIIIYSNVRERETKLKIYAVVKANSDSINTSFRP